MKVKGLKSTFLTGILVITPAFVSIFIIIVLFKKIDSVVSPFVVNLLQKYFLNLSLPHFAITVISVVFLFIFILLIGLIAENFIGKKLIKLMDKLLSSTPLVKGIYIAMKQLLDAFRFSNENRFNKVVFVEYPKKDMWVIGLTTSSLCNDLSCYFREKDMINVFIPTTPNPTSGYLVVVKKSEVVETQLTIEEAIKYVVSGGIIQPERCLND